MQLFITSGEREGNTICITEQRVVHQLKHVLRAKADDTFFVQQEKDDCVDRYTVRITHLGKNDIHGSIICEEKKYIQRQGTKPCLCVALPNKYEKLELIVQKITEIGLSHIIFFPSQYSQLRDVPSSKQERIQKIALEAAEQSYARTYPCIEYAESMKEKVQHGGRIVVCDVTDDLTPSGIKKEKEYEGKKIYCFVGPEGGRGEKDKDFFSSLVYEKKYFSTNVLRTETASILAARELVSQRI